MHSDCPYGNPHPDPVDEIEQRIHALSDADLERLAGRLAPWPGWTRVGYVLTRAILPGYLIAGAAAAALRLIDEIARNVQMQLTHQPKRGPSPETLDALRQIRQMRDANIKWTVIDIRLGLRPDRARELWNDAKRRGWLSML